MKSNSSNLRTPAPNEIRVPSVADMARVLDEVDRVKAVHRGENTSIDRDGNLLVWLE